MYIYVCMAGGALQEEPCTLDRRHIAKRKHEPISTLLIRRSPIGRIWGIANTALFNVENKTKCQMRRPFSHDISNLHSQY